MSTSEAHSQMEGFEALEEAVGHALSRLETLQSELSATRSRRDEVEELLQKMNSGQESPAHMAEQLRALQAENTDLRNRLQEGREVVERLLARVRYLEAHG